jgi:stearoyl-CoA desaturase (delta-9 desaturase)
VTWLVNSATHRWGYVCHASGDGSRNNWWVALLSFGEGWHNNHHAYPSSARMGFQWWEVDLTWQHIRLLRRLGLARRIRLAAPLHAAMPAHAATSPRATTSRRTTSSPQASRPFPSRQSR